MGAHESVPWELVEPSGEDGAVPWERVFKRLVNRTVYQMRYRKLIGHDPIGRQSHDGPIVTQTLATRG